MKKSISYILVLGLISGLYSCKKDGGGGNTATGGTTPQSTTPPPTPTVTAPTVPTVIIVTDGSSVYYNAAVIDLKTELTGGAAITETGVCWGTAQSPTIANNKIIASSQPVNGTGLGEFFPTITGLTVNTTYYARAYATNQAGTAYSNQVTFTTAYAIGQAFQGGLIFYVDNTKLHGLIVATSDQSTGAQWDNSPIGTNFVSPGAFSTSDGAGNTTMIINTLGAVGNAAAICKAYRGGGYSDWFLPAYNQLAQLWSEKNVLYPSTNSTGAFLNYNYWSSTESSSYIAFAWSLDFGSGTYYDNSLKTQPYPVRAIRAF
jgi:hypothetical protein